MDIKEIRTKIDSIDDELSKLVRQRMALSEEVALYKKESGMPVLDRQRERDILARISETDDKYDEYVRILYSMIFDLSRSNQDKLLNSYSEMSDTIKKALAETPQLFPQKATVACQGVEGAYSQIACDRLFSVPQIMYFNSFEGVFQSVANGLCRYGILPIENNLHGSVAEVYDLMKRYKFYIVRSIKLNIRHALMMKPGGKLSDIREIYSHNQAIGQCSEFLKTMKNAEVKICENTAMAAKFVAESNRNDIAAISSTNCAELYGLKIVDDTIQNSDNNYTRFICISKDMQIYPGTNKISVMFTISHRPGSLYSLLTKFSALGLNMTKLESRPIPGRDFEFMFYCDMEASVYSDDVLDLLDELEGGPEQFVFLGSYTEL